MSCLLTLLLVVVDFLLTALVLWVVTWALSLVGGTIAFSWLLAFVVWVVLKCIKIIF